MGLVQVIYLEDENNKEATVRIRKSTIEEMRWINTPTLR
jgi:hypothetical protein